MGRREPTGPASRVTAADVARRAGVSASAVSRVFTPGASVSKGTSDKVRKAAEALGYRPNILARAMITGKSRIIGLVVAHLDNQFYPEALERLSTALQAHGYHILVFMTAQAEAPVDEVLRGIMDYQIDGLVLASVSISSDLAERCRALGLPVVLFNRSQDDARVSAVTSDNVSGGRRVAEFLIAGGHRRIAYIAGWEGASTQRDRELGLTVGLMAHNREIHARAVGGFTTEGAAAATHALFGADNPPDAVFVANDIMAFAVIDTLRFALGLSVPDDVSVVGYDDVPAAAWPAYALTTVRQSAEAMVAETVTTLIEEIEATRSAPRRVAIDGPLILRGSARIPEGWPQ
ncbi:MAG: LacI family DNA-binding transcriptional regulator [Pseudomonadota bacterium]